MTITKLCVCGAGTMGSGIAQVSAQSGFSVILYDRDLQALEAGKEKINTSLQFLVGKGKLTEEQALSIKSKLHYTDQLKECTADLFIEAIVERLDAKAGLFNSLARFNDEYAIFATNTSSLPVTELAKFTEWPARVAGLHFFNPATIMKLVEVISTEFTDAHVIEQLKLFVNRLGKTAVLCKDSPGFIVNRVARPYYIESLRLVEEGQTTLLQADRLMESAGFKLGPFSLMDLIGNDVNYAVSCSVYEQLGEPARLKPSAIQKDLVAEGRLGKKTSRGYFDYN